MTTRKPDALTRAARRLVRAMDRRDWLKEIGSRSMDVAAFIAAIAKSDTTITRARAAVVKALAQQEAK